jgi:hypothetical protein
MAEFISPRTESRLLRGVVVAAGVLALVQAEPLHTNTAPQTSVARQSENDRAFDQKWGLLMGAARTVAESETCKITQVKDYGVHRIAPEGDRPASRRAVQLTIERHQSEDGQALEQTYAPDKDQTTGSVAITAVSTYQPLVVSGRRTDKLGSRRWIQAPVSVPNGYAPRNLNQQRWYIDHEPQQLQGAKREQTALKLWMTPYADWDESSTVRVKMGTEAYATQQVNSEAARLQSAVGTALCENVLVFEKHADGDGAWTLQQARPSEHSVEIN